MDGSESHCSSFVVADDDPSLAKELVDSERCLSSGALREVRAHLLEKIRALTVRVEAIDEELAALASSGSTISSSDSV